MTRIEIKGFFLTILFSMFHLLLSSDSSKPFFYECGTLNDNIDMNFKFRLNMLFSNLTSQAISSDTGFAFYTVNSDKQDQLTGLIMCYIDSSQKECLDCLNISTANAAVLCSDFSPATYMYGSCFLRYSNSNFLSTVTLNKNPDFYYNQHDISDTRTIDTTVSDLLNSLRDDATSSDKLLYSYGNKTDPGMNLMVYGLVQCTKDLDTTNCDLCLQYTIGNLSINMESGKQFQGARVSLPNCYIRYELYPLPLLDLKSLASAPEPSHPNLSPPSHAASFPNSASSALPESRAGQKTKYVAVAAVCAIGAFLSILLAGICFWRKRRTKQINKSASDTSSREIEAGIMNVDFQVFLLSELKSATSNFSEENKLGEGGFGSVYKGVLENEKHIAVKRLSGCSKQGYTEFKTEVDLLGKLKHKNLVKLHGYCIERNEKLLCYEYLPRGSLDSVLFKFADKFKKEKLSWQTRYKIIDGISTGLQYLHTESGFKIVHRDLKPNNILLDEDMNPKISDFGLARLYQDDQTHIETSNIAGTQGYMAPEYVMDGIYSEKSDVYSFGILLLEIVAGRKNSSFCNNQSGFNLRTYALQQYWARGEVEALKDPTLEDIYSKQISRCIRIGLHCIQENPNSRPNMNAVNLMLCNDSMVIPDLPKLISRPEFLLSQSSMSSTGNSDLVSSGSSSSTNVIEAKRNWENNTNSKLAP